MNACVPVCLCSCSCLAQPSCAVSQRTRVSRTSCHPGGRPRGSCAMALPLLRPSGLALSVWTPSTGQEWCQRCEWCWGEGDDAGCGAYGCWGWWGSLAMSTASTGQEGCQRCKSWWWFRGRGTDAGCGLCSGWWGECVVSKMSACGTARARGRRKRGRTARTYHHSTHCCGHDICLLTGCCCHCCCCSNLPLTPFPGPLPKSWGDLLEPVEFDLQLNFITGTLPPEYAKLTKLRSL